MDQALFAALPEGDAAMVVLHETMSSYLGADLALRSTKLRSAVKALSLAASGMIGTRAQLAYQLQMDGVQFPFLTDELDLYRNYLLLVLGSPDQQTAVLTASPDLTALMNLGASLPTASDALSACDQRALSALSPERLVTELCVAGDPSVIDALLGNASLPDGALSACLGSAGRIRLSAVVASPGFPAVLRAFMSTLASARVSIASDSNGRIVVDSTLSALTASAPGTLATAQLTSLVPLSPTNGTRFNDQGFAIYSYIKLLVMSGRWSDLQSQVVGSPLFYRAFGTAGLLSQLDALDPPVTREKELAHDVITEIVAGFWSTVTARLDAEVSPAAAARLKSMIDWGRVGAQF